MLKRLQVTERSQSPKDPNTSADIPNLAQLQRNKFDYQLSLVYELKCLSLREEIYSPDHIKIDQSLSNIGLCYENLYELKLAFEYYQRALHIYQQSDMYPFNEIQRLHQDIQRISEFLYE